MPEFVMEGECEPIQLEPFVHQVGGHSSMLRFDDTTVCKPLISRECHFYEVMPPDMREFTPQYRGIIEVAFQEDSDGYMTLVAYPPESKKKKKSQRRLSLGSSQSSSGEGVQSDSDSESNPTKKIKQRFRMRRSGSIEVDKGNREQMFELVDPNREKDKSVSTTGHNPWSLRCHKEQLAKMRKMSKGSNTHKFILLENLASHFHLPCILDLKMGTRQHGDDASDEKRQTQIQKCALSTSSTLGLRICGMQVYQANSGHYICHNKYYGRKLTIEGVQETLHQFFHNGCELRVDLIDPILERLRQLYSLLSKQNTFRFYSSSLLIMYDGGLIEEEEEEDEESESVDDQEGDETMDSEDMDEHSEIDDVCEASGSGNSRSMRWNASASLGQHKYYKHSPLNHGVDVRMIDFAHTTHQGFRGDCTVHSGPDQGYLFGLENLMRMIEQVKARAS